MRAVVIKNKNFRKNMENVPRGITGLYYFYIDKELVYIGRALCVRGRLQCHFSRRGSLNQTHINHSKVNKVLIVGGCYDEEFKEIQKYKPRWNIIYGGYKEIEDYFCAFCLTRHKDERDCECYKAIRAGLVDKMRQASEQKYFGKIDDFLQKTN